MQEIDATLYLDVAGKVLAQSRFQDHRLAGRHRFATQGLTHPETHKEP